MSKILSNYNLKCRQLIAAGASSISCREAFVQTVNQFHNFVRFPYESPLNYENRDSFICTMHSKLESRVLVDGVVLKGQEAGFRIYFF